MKQRPSPFPWIFALYCFCALQFTPGFPQPVSRSMDAPEVPKSELALCFSQWTELSNQPQISSKAMDLCNAIFSSMQIDESEKDKMHHDYRVSDNQFTQITCNDFKIITGSVLKSLEMEELLKTVVSRPLKEFHGI
ncbi:unnamed protein product [Caretta caretta]